MIIFDGKAYAKKIEEDLIKSGKLKGKKLLIVSSDPDNPYVRLKREFGERCDVIVEVTPPESPLKLRGGWGSYDGVLVQLPTKDKKILEEIPVEKDVDGLRKKSKFLHAAVVAVEKILNEAERTGSFYFDIFLKTAVVGAKGVVGSAIVARLREKGFVVKELDKGCDYGLLSDCDIVVSAVGSEGLIKPEMLMDGVVVIDLGFPKGDFDPAVVKKAIFFTPVPGGVGPVTIACLYENLATMPVP
jgi:methylenetetrahydrofolate dehydrogenase (NADP+)/methenyltetrahydrofolate cyclohydrolase